MGHLVTGAFATTRRSRCTQPFRSGLHFQPSSEVRRAVNPEWIWIQWTQIRQPFADGTI